MTHAITTLLGRAGRDAEVRMTQTGKQIVTCSLAVGSGEKTTWFSIQAWEKTGLKTTRPQQGKRSRNCRPVCRGHRL